MLPLFVSSPPALFWLQLDPNDRWLARPIVLVLAATAQISVVSIVTRLGLTLA